MQPLESSPGGRGLTRWAVCGIGAVLLSWSLGAAALTVEFGTGESVVFVAPVLAGVGVVGLGLGLVARGYDGAAVARVAGWTALTTLGVAPLAVWQIVLADLSGPSVTDAAHVLAFVAFGALAGAGVGVYDVQRHRESATVADAETILETTRDGIATLSADLTYERVNPAFAELRGYDDPNELLGKPYSQGFTTAEVERIESTVLPAVEETGSWTGELLAERRDGTTYVQETSVTALPTGGTAIIARDVTRRRQQERQLRTVVQNAPIAVFEYDQNGVVETIEGRLAEDLGLDGDAIVGTDVRSLFEDQPALLADIDRAVAGEPVESTFELRGRHLHSWVVPRTEDGEVVRVVGTVVDISDRVEYERGLAALHEMSQELTLAKSATTVAQHTVEIAGRVLDTPLAAVWRYESTRDVLEPVAVSEDGLEIYEAAGLDGLPVVGPGSATMAAYREGEITVIEDYREAHLEGAPDLDLGTVIIVPLGEYGVLVLSRQEAGAVSEADCDQVEILAATTRAALESAAREDSLRQREAAVEALHDATRRMMSVESEREICEVAVETAHSTLGLPMTGVWLADESAHRLTPASATEEKRDVIEELPVYEAGDAVYDQVFEREETIYYTDYDDDARPGSAAEALASEIVTAIGRHGVLKTGAVEPNAFDEVDVALVKLLAANTAAALERAERERALQRRTDQMEFFNSILRHDVLNGITVIRGHAELLAEDLDGSMGRSANTIVSWSDDVADVVKRVRHVLRQLTGEEQTDRETTNLSSALNHELDRLADTYDDVTVERDVPDGLVVLADDLLAEVLGNVLTNAVVHNDPEGLVVSATAERDGDVVEVRIEDNGVGVPEADRERVFRRGERGQTSGNTGFGLYFVDAMVSAYEGDVSIEDAPDGGAAFVIRLPANPLTADGGLK